MSQRPVASWGLDPAFWAYRKIFIGQIYCFGRGHGEAVGYFFEGAVPVAFVEISGLVTEVVVTTKNVKYLLDDGSGAIWCIFWREQDKCGNYVERSNGKWGLRLGDFAAVQGKLGEYRQQLQVVGKMALVDNDTNGEMCTWLRNMEVDESYQSHKSVRKTNVLSRLSNTTQNSKRHMPPLKLSSAAELVYGFILEEAKITCSVHDIHTVLKASESDTNAITDSVVEEMISVGLLYPKSPINRDVFEVVGNPRVMQLENLLSSGSKTSRELLGILKKERKFANISISIVVSALKELIETSKIFPVEDNKYAVL